MSNKIVKKATFVKPTTYNLIFAVLLTFIIYQSEKRNSKVLQRI